MANDRIKVIGYAQKIRYNDGIEYRPFSPDLVGLQLTSDGGTPLFTMGSFNITTNLDPKPSKIFITNSFSSYQSLNDLNLTIEETLELLRLNAGVTLNLDKTKLSNYALFGSLTEFIRISLENIIITWPASLWIYPEYEVENTGISYSAYTVQNYTYNALSEESTFNINTNVIQNKFQINFLKSGVINNTFNASNDLRNFTVNYSSYCILNQDTEYDVLGLTAATNSKNDYITLRVKGNPFSGVNSSPIYHIKPNKLKVDSFFNGLPKFEKYILNRQSNPLYTCDFTHSVKSDGGALLYVTDTLTWPVYDGYNIDFDSTRYEDYASSLLEIATQSDTSTTGLMTRFLVSDSITGFDTLPVFLDPLHEDTSGGKINKTLNIYGRSFDDINNFISGIAMAYTVTYDKNDNTPDVYLKNLAKVMGWDIVSSVLENNLLASYVTTKKTSFSGQSVGLTALEADSELWRRIILNTPWIWKSKGTRKAIEFLFRFIGAPNGLVSFNEYVYIANNTIDTNLLTSVIELNGLDSSSDLYPVDPNGYPNPLPNTDDMYFQNLGGWYRETGGANSSIDIVTGNNPHVGPYDNGYKYISQFQSIIPNFTAVTVTSVTNTTDVVNLFTNYNHGIMDGYTGNTFVDSTFLNGNDISNCYDVVSIITSNHNQSVNDCGCDNPSGDVLSIYVDNLENPACNTSVKSPFKLILNPKGSDGVYYYPDDNGINQLDISFDWLFKFACNDLKRTLVTSELQCNDPLLALKTLDVSMTLDVVSGSSLVTVYENDFFQSKGNLYEYLSGKTNNTGFLVCGGIKKDDECYGIDLYNLSTSAGTINCQIVHNNIMNGLFIESGLSGNTNADSIFKSNIDKNALNSNWQRFNVSITDPSILSAITSEKVKLTIKVNNACVDFYVLLDNIELNKTTTKIKDTSIFVSKSPSFDLNRVRDNKKSWIGNTTPLNRKFSVSTFDGNKPIRVTNYNLLDDRQIINSKEVDLDISVASAIETDVWCHVINNPCILTGITHQYSATTCSAVTYGNVITSTTIVSAITVVTAQTIVTATTATTVTTGTTTGFTCPVGYSLTVGNDSCIKTTISGATLNSTGSTILRGNQNENYGKFGANFYDFIQNNPNLPITLTNTGLRDQIGTPILPITNSTNSYWLASDMSTGRLNNVGISATSTEFLGFSKCVDAPVSGTYYIGFAADNFCRVRVNGELIINFLNGITEAFNYWYVFPYFLNSGLNVIEMEGMNSGSDTSFGCEVYYPASFNALVNSTSSATTGTIFSSLDTVNSTFNLGTTVGYSCPAGYVLDLCTSTAATCTQILRQAPTATAGTESITATTTTTGTSIVTGTTIVNTNILLTGSSIGSGVTITCCSSDSHCGDNQINFNQLLTEPLSATTTIEEFEYIINTELIDAKNRQTISEYATLKALYDRYLNSSIFCGVSSSAYGYDSINKFSKLISNYWVDLIEQVVPATTIWNATKIYTNTMFDNQKHKYKSYSLLLGQQTDFSKVLSPTSGYQDIAVTTIDIPMSTSGITFGTPAQTSYNTIHIRQSNSGSEFLGYIESAKRCKINALAITTETNIVSAGTATAVVTGNYGPVTYLWSDGQTGQTAVNLSAGTYSLTVTDTGLSGCTAFTEFEIIETPRPIVSLRVDSVNSKVVGLGVNSTTQGTWVDWGDGTLSGGTGYRNMSHVYQTPYTGPITLNGYDNLDGVTIWETRSGRTESAYTAGTTDNFLNIRFDTVELTKLPNLIVWHNYAGTNSAMRGLVSNIPPKVTEISANEQNNSVYNTEFIYGNTLDLPRSCVTISIGASNRISGSTYGFPVTSDFIYLTGSNTVSGSTYGLPRVMTHLSIEGFNTISDNVTGIPVNCNFFIVLGANQITGNVTGITSAMTTLLIDGVNTVSGDISGFPRSLTSCTIRGNNTLSGITNSFPTGLTFVQIFGNNTITGPISGYPRTATSIYMEGNNTIFGDIADIPNGISYWQNEPSGALTYTSGRTWNTSSIGLMRLFPTSLSSANLDNLLVDLANTGSFVQSPQCKLTFFGSASTPTYTAAVVAAINTLSGSPNNVILEFN